MKIVSYPRIVAAAFTLAASASIAQAQTTIVYRENFTNGSDSGTAFTLVGWSSIGIGRAAIGVDNAIYSNTSTPIPTPVLQTSSSGANPGPGNTTVGVNNTGTFASPTNGGAGTGFVYVNGNNFKAFLAYAGDGIDYFGAGRSIASNTLNQVRVQTGLTTGGAAGTIVPAVKVGAQWYVYTGTVANPVTAPTTVAGAGAFTSSSAFQTWGEAVFTSTSWATLDTTTVSSNSFSIGASGLLPNGNVNAIGFYASGFGTGGNYRIDNFEVTTGPAPIPEPSAFAALAGLGALGLAASRRRSRRG